MKSKLKAGVSCDSSSPPPRSGMVGRRGEAGHFASPVPPGKTQQKQKVPGSAASQGTQRGWQGWLEMRELLPKPVSRWRTAIFQLASVPEVPLHGVRGVRGPGTWTLSS